MLSVKKIYQVFPQTCHADEGSISVRYSAIKIRNLCRDSNRDSPPINDVF